MPFLDKLGDLARNLGDKASSVIEVNKLNSRISSEKAAISECMRQIGEYYYGKHSAGELADSGVIELFAAIESHSQTMGDIQAEITRIQAENAAQAQSARGGVSAPFEDSLVCSSCGATNPPDTNFCGECGAKIEPPSSAPADPGALTCPSCGAHVVATARFCGGCGFKFE